MQLPCGQCIGCRLERSRQWAMRCLHESSLYDNNCFITLTYDDDNVPAGNTLVYSDFQKFMKRLRRRFFSSEIRFYMCGEYGESTSRPHYHALLFNFDFPDKAYFRKEGDNRLYTSLILEQLWPFGMSVIGDLTFESAAYCARYCVSKITGPDADAHYKWIDPDSGEIFDRVPEFNHMSLKPGIGRPWLDKYMSDVFPRDYCVVNGKEVKPAKYYDRVFSKLNPAGFELVQLQREFDACNNGYDSSDERLKVREQVITSRFNLSSRGL